MQYSYGHIANQFWNQINERAEEKIRYFCNGQDKTESMKPAMGMMGRNRELESHDSCSLISET